MTPEKVRNGIIEEKVSPELLAKLEYQYPGVNHALADLIDNSYDARREGELVTIHINLEEDSFMISDYGGYGMDLDELRNFFNWGFSEKRGKLGRYGFGGKAALEYCGSGFTLVCSIHGGKEYHRIEELDWGDRSMGFKKIRYQTESRKPGHGFVQIELLGLKRKIDPEELGKFLGKTYRSAISNNRMAIILNEKLIQPLRIPPEWEMTRFEFEFIGDASVKGWIGQIPEDQEVSSAINPGMMGNIFDRLIADELFFGHPPPNKNPATRFLIGEFNIDSGDIPVLTGKTDFDRGSWQWGLLTEKMHGLLSPYVAELIEASGKPRVLRGDKPAFNEALYLIRQALVAMGELSHGIKPRQEIGQKKGEATSVKKREHTPRTPRPEEAVGSRGRLPVGGMVEIISRNLPHSRRSAMSLEDGKRILIINPNTRAYKTARKGRRENRKPNLVRYILERAADEIAFLPPSEDDITPQEYERKVEPYQENLTVSNYRERVDKYNDAFIKAGNKARLL